MTTGYKWQEKILATILVAVFSQVLPRCQTKRNMEGRGTGRGGKKRGGGGGGREEEIRTSVSDREARSSKPSLFRPGLTDRITGDSFVGARGLCSLVPSLCFTVKRHLHIDVENTGVQLILWPPRQK